MQRVQELQILQALRKRRRHVRSVQEATDDQGTVKMKIALGLMICVGLLAACDADRISKLEKANTDLKAKVEKQSTALDYDLQQKCAKDAQSWFASRFPETKIRSIWTTRTFTAKS